MSAFITVAFAETEKTGVLERLDLAKHCMEQLKTIPGVMPESDVIGLCSKVKQLDGCQSVGGAAIFHYDHPGTAKNPKRIFAKALIHGDEVLAGTVVRAWAARLEKIEPRNTWRLVMIANPDGWKNKSRTNAKGVDLNRNFPSKDWEEQALSYWKKKTKSDPRRYPGPKAESEIETQCLMKHFADFKPDLLISVHTPLGVLDLDGPKLKDPGFKALPWISLGNFPGSLGRYMWVDQKVPVLTVELKGTEDMKRLEEFDRLQDISGTIAILADKARKSANSKSSKN